MGVMVSAVVLAAGALLLALASWRLKTEAHKALCFNAAMILGVLAGAEGFFLYLHVDRVEAAEDLTQEGLYETVDDTLLGYGLPPSSAWTAERLRDGEPVFRVPYTTNGHGLRITPTPSQASASVLFFGGSFTFGEGLSDSDSFPWRVGELLGDRAKAINFGVYGYGPQQMLAAIEGGRVERVRHGSPSVAVYTGIPDHLSRAAGRRAHLAEGPHYEIAEDGVLRRASNSPRSSPSWLQRWLTWRAFREAPWSYGEGQIAVYAEIVAQARRRLARAYEGLEFHVVFWDPPQNALADRMIDALEERNLTVHRISEILPDFPHPERYRISRFDAHPSATANEIVASYLLDEVIEPALPGEDPGVDESS